MIAGTNFTSIGLLLGGLVFYAGILVIVGMFKNETYLSIALAAAIHGRGGDLRVRFHRLVGASFAEQMEGPDCRISPGWVCSNILSLLQHDPRFGIDVRNTGVFTVGFILGCLIIGLGLAILLDQRLKGEALFRGIFLFPDVHLIHRLGRGLGLADEPGDGEPHHRHQPDLPDTCISISLISLWHSTPQPWGMAFTVIPAVWQLSGFTMALYLGGLRSIPEELREAARVDGASEFQIYRYIIMPMLQPVTLSAVIILGHMSLKIFDLIVALGHKDMRLDVPGIYMWTTTFDGTNYAQGAAIGVLMLVSVAILVVPYLVHSMRTEAEL